MYILFGHLIPHFQEDSLQGIHLLSLNSAVHIAPTPHHFCALDVIVGHIHTASIGHITIYDNDFAVVAVEYMVHPRKLNGVELKDFDTPFAQGTQVLFQQRTIVRVVSKPIEQGAYPHTFVRLLYKQLEKAVGNGVVSKIKVF